MTLNEIEMRIFVDIEEFRIITYPGIKPDTYMISNFGNIIYKNTQNPRSIRPDKDGYMCVGLMKSTGKQTVYRVHRLVAWEFCENRDIDLVVNHKDACKYNNYYKNLEWVSVSYNTLHGYDVGEGKDGESHYRNIYPEAMIHDICKLIKEGYVQGDIYNIVSKKYNIVTCKKKCINLIKDVRRKKVWRKVTKLYDF